MSELQRHTGKSEDSGTELDKNKNADDKKFNIGDFLRYARRHAGITQEELANKMNTKKSAISRIENHSDNIRLSTLYNYTEALGCRGILDEAMKPLMDTKNILNQTISESVFKAMNEAIKASTLLSAQSVFEQASAASTLTGMIDALSACNQRVDQATPLLSAQCAFEQAPAVSALTGVNEAWSACNQRVDQASALLSAQCAFEQATAVSALTGVNEAWSACNQRVDQASALLSAQCAFEQAPAVSALTGVNEAWSAGNQTVDQFMGVSHNIMNETMKQVWDSEKVPNAVLLGNNVINETIEPLQIDKKFFITTPENQNLASEFYKRLVKKINHFNESLDDEYEVGVRLVNFGQAVTFHLQDMDYLNPSLISFVGDTNPGTETNERVELIQHVSQISILLMKLKRKDPSQPKHPFGFTIEENFQ